MSIQPPLQRDSKAAALSAENPIAALRCASLIQFVTRARELLDATDEPSRQRLEDEVLKLALPLQTAGIFEVFTIADPALAAMVRDHLEESNLDRVVALCQAY